MLFIWYLLQQSSGRVGCVPWQYKQKTDLENFVGFRPPEAGLPVHLHQVGWNRKNSGNIHFNPPLFSPQGAADVDISPSDRSKVTITEIKKTKWTIFLSQCCLCCQINDVKLQKINKSASLLNILDQSFDTPKQQRDYHFWEANQKRLFSMYI